MFISRRHHHYTQTYVWFVQLLSNGELTNFYLMDNREHLKEAIELTFKNKHEVIETDRAIIVHDAEGVCLSASLQPIWQQPIQMV